MDLGEALYRAITNGRSPRTEPDGFGAAVRWFVKAAGGNVSAAARLAGVPRRSFRDWMSGKSQPRAERRSALLAAARQGERRARLKPGRERRLRATDPDAVRAAGSYNYDGDTKENFRPNIRIGPYLDGNAINDLIDAYLSGASTDELRETFAASITEEDPGNRFYQDTMRLPSSDAHGWTMASVSLEGRRYDDDE